MKLVAEGVSHRYTSSWFMADLDHVVVDCRQEPKLPGAVPKGWIPCSACLQSHTGADIISRDYQTAWFYHQWGQSSIRYDEINCP